MSELTFQRNYACEITIDQNALNLVAKNLELKRGTKVAILTSINVNEGLLNNLANDLQSCGYLTYNYPLQDGESAKNLECAGEFSAFLQKNLFTRTDIIINVGGGTVCDLGAFVASVYMRGIRYVNVPTTLLCAVDACIGGKTAIDVGNVKNLWGSFYQPYKVFVDLNLLINLPQKIFAEGMSEIVKYGVIKNSFGTYLKNLGDLNAIKQNLKKIITKCLAIKSKIVCQDELDYSKRRLLNAGHTVAHALESHSNFSLTHAQAVAEGLKIECEMSFKLGNIDEQRRDFIRNLLKIYTVSSNFDFNKEDLISAMLLDKKNTNDKISFILPTNSSVKQVFLTKDQIESIL